jgi:hypothetical protein
MKAADPFVETDRLSRLGYYDVVRPGKKALRPPPEVDVFEIPSDADPSRPARVVGRDQRLESRFDIEYTTRDGEKRRGRFTPLTRLARAHRPDLKWVDMEPDHLWVAQVLHPSSARPFDWYTHYRHGNARKIAGYEAPSALAKLASWLRGEAAGA